jgi:hypothetical protein
MSALLDELLAAHGGADALDEIGDVAVALDVGGLAFTAHRQPGRFSLRATVDAHVPHVVFADFLGSGREAVFTPDRVSVGDAVREHPRDAYGDLLFRWDELHLAWFCGYALWNYVTTPWLLASEGVRVEDLPGRRLRATFPPDVPTHSPVQVFHIGGDGLLERIDYTALVFGRWARGTHVCRDHRRFGPVVAPTRRRVTPRIGSRPLPGPTFVWIEVERYEPRARGRA